MTTIEDNEISIEEANDLQPEPQDALIEISTSNEGSKRRHPGPAAEHPIWDYFRSVEILVRKWINVSKFIEISMRRVSNSGVVCGRRKRVLCFWSCVERSSS